MTGKEDETKGEYYKNIMKTHQQGLVYLVDVPDDRLADLLQPFENVKVIPLKDVTPIY